MPTPAKTSIDRRFAALWAAAGLCELPVLALLVGFDLGLPGWAVPLGHILCAALVFFAPSREKGWFLPSRHWGEGLGLATLLMPGLGWVMAGWLVMARGEAVRAKSAYRFDDDAPDDANPLAALGTPEAIRKELADALDVLPAADALLSADPALKRGAIETLARIRSVDSVGWILRARTDPDPEVRFFATTAITRLNHDFDAAIQASSREVLAKPGDPELQLALQRVRYEYAVSGMLDASAREGLLLVSRKALQASAERDPAAARLAFLVERELDPASSFSALDRLERLDPGKRLRWVRERAELCFRLGRHAEVRRLLLEDKEPLLAEAGSDPEWRSAVLWWTHA
ncbi:MAG: hypothetical protein HY928_04845 [Elusimicrobia bacterium]|nr:hypothetical protein [Elusimicrobiota bacterium]